MMRERERYYGRMERWQQLRMMRAVMVRTVAVMMMTRRMRTMRREH